MKKLIPIFILITLCCSGNSLPVQKQAQFFMPMPVTGGGGSFTYTFITNVSVSASANAIVTSSAIDCRDANLAVYNLRWLTGAPTVNTKDKNNNTYYGATVNSFTNSGGNVNFKQWYCTNGTFDSTMTWTVEVAGGIGYPTLTVSLYKKSSGTPTFDSAVGTNGASATSATWTIPPATPSADNELIVGGGMLGSTFTRTPTGMADGSQVYTAIHTTTGGGTFYLIQNTATTIAPTITFDGSDNQFAGGNILFR